MLLAENVVIDLGEDYQKQSYRNRYYLYAASGRVPLSIPVSKPDGNHTPVHRVLLSDHEPWQRTHWRTLEAAYKKSPYYIHYADEVRRLVFASTDKLAVYNQHCFQGICELLEVSVSYSFSELYCQGEGAVDMRNTITPKQETPVARFLQTCFYHQVFEEKQGYLADLSLLDLLFNMGPEAEGWLRKVIRDYRSASAG